MGYFIVFKLSQLQIKEAIKTDIQNGVINNELSVIVIKKADIAKLEWEEENEFEYEGSMYDVIDQKEGADAITFYCINDSKEFSLICGLDDHIKNHVSSSKPIKENSTKSITENPSKYFPNELISFAPTGNVVEKDLTFSPIYLNYKFAVIKASFQPPELA